MLAPMISLVKRLCTSERFFIHWAALVWVADFVLTWVIFWKIPFTNVDYEAYSDQVEGLVNGVFDYTKLRGKTGPIAYPAGFLWFFFFFRAIGYGVVQMQVVFSLLYLATMACVFQIYRLARAPGWLLALCVLSKRVHSIYTLRVFNDGVAQFFFYLALMLFLQHRTKASAMVYAVAVSIKIHPLLSCPAIGLCLALRCGWSEALALIGHMLAFQMSIATPFLMANPWGYLSRAFGGPGDLQHAWSVNWKFLPEELFLHRAFAPTLLGCHVLLGALFAHRRWLPGGFLDRRVWRWSGKSSLNNQGIVCLWFACNFLGVVFLRTLHFQYLVWYFHTVPFLAWYALQPERHQGLGWLVRCALVVALTLGVEVPYLLTTQGLVRGPDGRAWTTDGVPTRHGSLLLQGVHITLLILLTRRPVQLLKDAEDKSD